jgi:NAD(P)-dependent dehydrogenase (short-subunit alcohol dehydrogenase family)
VNDRIKTVLVIGATSDIGRAIARSGGQWVRGAAGGLPVGCVAANGLDKRFVFREVAP